MPEVCQDLAVPAALRLSQPAQRHLRGMVVLAAAHRLEQEQVQAVLVEQELEARSLSTAVPAQPATRSAQAVCLRHSAALLGKVELVIH